VTKEHDRVVLTKAVTGEGLEAGDVGTVVHPYGDGKAYEVEFIKLSPIRNRKSLPGPLRPQPRCAHRAVQ
jgi:Domain of unknown function (DUF4926)